MSAALDSHSHLDTSNSRAIITHYYHLLELLLIAVLLWRNCGHFLAPVRIASSWRTANVDRYERDACVHVSVIETKRMLIYSLSDTLYLR